jgi:hypothetical protein
MRSIKDLGCRFAYDEYRESTVYSDYGSQKDSSDSKNCWFEFLANRSVRLKDLEETIAVYEYAVNESGIADYPLNGRGDGPQQYQPEMRILPQDGSDAGPFIAATGGAGKNMLQQRTANAPAQDGLLPLAAAAGAGAVAYGCLAFGSPNLRKPEGQITEQTGPGLKAGQTEAIVKPPQNQGGK